MRTSETRRELNWCLVTVAETTAAAYSYSPTGALRASTAATNPYRYQGVTGDYTDMPQPRPHGGPRRGCCANSSAAASATPPGSQSSPATRPPSSHCRASRSAPALGPALVARFALISGLPAVQADLTPAGRDRGPRRAGHVGHKPRSHRKHWAGSVRTSGEAPHLGLDMPAHGINYRSKHGVEGGCSAFWLRQLDDGRATSAEPLIAGKGLAINLYC